MGICKNYDILMFPYSIAVIKITIFTKLLICPAKRNGGFAQMYT